MGSYPETSIDPVFVVFFLTVHPWWCALGTLMAPVLSAATETREQSSGQTGTEVILQSKDKSLTLPTLAIAGAVAPAIVK